jgi:hypothetical protein
MGMLEERIKARIVTMHSSSVVLKCVPLRQLLCSTREQSCYRVSCLQLEIGRDQSFHPKYVMARYDIRSVRVLLLCRCRAFSKLVFQRMSKLGIRDNLLS